MAHESKGVDPLLSNPLFVALGQQFKSVLNRVEELSKEGAERQKSDIEKLNSMIVLEFKLIDKRMIKIEEQERKNKSEIDYCNVMVKYNDQRMETLLENQKNFNDLQKLVADEIRKLQRFAVLFSKKERCSNEQEECKKLIDEFKSNLKNSPDEDREMNLLLPPSRLQLD